MPGPTDASTDPPPPKPPRMQTGIKRLDGLLGGGLIPGTLTVVVGATGIGKTQLGLHFARQGVIQENQSGIVLDLTARGDSQSHREYAKRIFGWELTERSVDERLEPAHFFESERARRDYLHLFDRSGRRVSIADLEAEEWRRWKIELARKLELAVGFFYGNFIHGVRRCVVDGVEPAEKNSESFQFHVFDYVYHQVLRKDADWLARDLFREQYRANEAQVARHPYDQGALGCLLLWTSPEALLEELLARRLESGDVLTNANTIILLGKVRDGHGMGRALHVAKHRGSFCDGAVIPFRLTDRGFEL